MDNAPKEIYAYVAKDTGNVALLPEHQQGLPHALRYVLAAKVAEWEYFCDSSYYDMWAVRMKGENRWGFCFHVPSMAEAQGLCGLLNETPLPDNATIGRRQKK